MPTDVGEPGPGIVPQCSAPAVFEAPGSETIKQETEASFDAAPLNTEQFGTIQRFDDESPGTKIIGTPRHRPAKPPSTTPSDGAALCTKAPSCDAELDRLKKIESSLASHAVASKDLTLSASALLGYPILTDEHYWV